MTNDPMTKNYKLKPGKHQFAPGSHAMHHNDNLTDAEAKWYLDRYPHIASLFISLPNEQEEEIKVPGKKESRMKSKIKSNNSIELLTPPSGGLGVN